MIIIVNGIRGGVNWLNLTSYVTDEEEGFELISRYVTCGLTLLNATLIDGESKLELPIEAFDGQSFSEQFHQLEKQWNGVLALPAPPISTLNNKQMTLWNQQLIRYYVQQLSRLDRYAFHLQRGLQKTEKKPESTVKHCLTDQYMSLLEGVKKMQLDIHFSRLQAVNRLAELEQ